MYGRCLNTEQTSGTHTIFWMNMNMKLFMDGDSLTKIFLQKNLLYLLNEQTEKMLISALLHSAECDWLFLDSSTIVLLF